MSGNSIGSMKGKTGFGKKGYEPGTMIAKMNSQKKGNIPTKSTSIKSTIKKII